MPRGVERTKPTREELTARLLAQREVRQARADVRATAAEERTIRRHVAHSSLPANNDSWSALPKQAKQRKLQRAKAHSKKLKDRLFQMFDAAEQIDARIEELEQLE
jgi:hypothetical protein